MQDETKKSRVVEPRQEVCAPRYPAGGAFSCRRRDLLVGVAVGTAVVGVAVHLPMALADVPPPRDKDRPAMVTEEPTLVLNKGYVVRLEWTRPVTNSRPPKGLQGMVSTLNEFLERNASATKLHDPSALKRLEGEILARLTPAVLPAIIRQVSLEHDCYQVCGKDRGMAKGKRRPAPKPRNKDGVL